MMTDILYALIAIVCAIVLEIFLNRTLLIMKDSHEDKGFPRLLLICFLFCFVDAFWGFMASHTLNWGRGALIFISTCFHLMASITAYEWLLYVLRFLDDARTIIIKWIGLIPLTAQIVLLAINFKTEIIFRVDEACEYYSGGFRSVLFILQYTYFLLAAVGALIRVISEKDAYLRKRGFAVIVFSLVPIVTGLFQLIYPYAPFYSIGFMLAATVIFTYNVSDEHAHMLSLENRITKMISRENRDTVNALAGIYEAMYLVDLSTGMQKELKSTASLHAAMGDATTVSEQFKNVVNRAVVEENRADMMKFIDFATLAERMAGKQDIFIDIQSVKEGWCRASFIRVADNEDGSPATVLFAAEIINEEKERELKYQKALEKALQNQNEIYAEMLQMQSNGIVATGMDNSFLMMNDAAARMFGLPDADHFDGNIVSLVEMAEIENKEAVLQSYSALKAIGGRISFEFSICRDGLNSVYIMATSKLAEMSSHEKVVITSLTNITKNKKLEHELVQLSETDALTGIRNRGSGERRISHMIEENVTGLFVLMDVDKFKSINDTFGHGVGDKALIEVAKCLTRSFRGQDIIMRLGGDEFAVYAVGVEKPDTAKNCIERLFEEIDSIDIEEMRGSGRKISISLGAVLCQGDKMKPFDELYQMADSAMYKSKKTDGNHAGMA